MTAAHRPVYRHKDMQRLFNPSSIAVYGVSPNPTSMGAKGFANMRGFNGPVYAINAKYQEMGDKDGARELLNEVLREGDAAQQGQAKQMLAKLG